MYISKRIVIANLCATVFAAGLVLIADTNTAHAHSMA